MSEADEHDDGPGGKVRDFLERRARIRAELGGAERVESLRAGGGRTVRDHIAGLLDPGTFEELGTFSHSQRGEDAASTPGDGKVGGGGLIAGRAVTVAGDDLTVKRGSSSMIGSRKLGKLFDGAMRAGHPFVYFGATGGARIPDSLGSAGFSKVSPGATMFARRRRIPAVTAIVGDSFGGSSFISAASDFVVQVRGTCLAVTSPRVVEIATGERIEMEELGGADVHLRRTGQVDLAVDTPDEAHAAIRRFLSYLPANGWTRSLRGERAAELQSDPGLASIVPERRSRGYDVTKLLARVADAGSVMELGAAYGRGLSGSLARIDGIAVGMLASQPKFAAGTLDPAACEKAVRLICLCDAFDLPIIFLQDCPGFFVGAGVEHDGMLKHAIRLQSAISLARTPKLTVILRKAYGMAYYSLGGNDTGVDAIYAWPGSEISFMDPQVAANVIAGDGLAGLGDAERRERLAEAGEAIAADTDPYGAAGRLAIDEIIDPAETRLVLAKALDRLTGRRFEPGCERPLASWPSR